MALVPYTRKRPYGSAFGGYAPSLQLAQRPRYTMMAGMARAGSYSNRRGGRLARRGGYQRFFTGQNLRTHPVYPRPEVKAFDFTSAAANIDITGAFINCINQIPAGTGLQQRIGNQIATKSVYYQYVLNFGTGPVPNAIRHLLVWDKQPNGAVALPTDVLVTGPTLLTSPMNLNNRDRFVILADERTTLSPNGDQIRIISGFRNINQRTDFNQSGSPTVPTTGALLTIFVSDETVVANEPNVYGTWRVRYIDC